MPPSQATASSSAQFCARILGAAAAPLPQAAAEAACRSLFNVLGITVGAARSPAVEAILAAALAGQGDATVANSGRVEALDPYRAALVVGTAAHLDDFDDTHLATVIHSGAAALATVLSLQPEARASGARCLTAFGLGCETQLRIGNAISPSHYDRGWHITGTCGVFGAAVAAAVLLGLDAEGLEQSLSLASVMMLGHREAFGSMTKPFHAGKATVNGVLAARLADSGLSGAADPLGPGGVLEVLAGTVDRQALAGSWDSGWEVERNTFKPYPCGIVSHPLIDAAVAASGQLGDPGAVTAVAVTCNPLLPELMRRRKQADGLKARFSAYHAVAVGLLDGEVGLVQFADDRATAREVARLRDLITLHPTPGCVRDEAAIVGGLAEARAAGWCLATAAGVVGALPQPACCGCPPRRHVTRSACAPLKPSAWPAPKEPPPPLCRSARRGLTPSRQSCSAGTASLRRHGPWRAGEDSSRCSARYRDLQ